ncbi:unnamed protein product [Linum tenue]|uniref:Uncharacterized protein n=1 Tax=Linum tenue TaxID=586396 RepID=A0AAV0IQH8_9ROSI|nr:unnamed protein product [Linum tenue]
MWPVGEQYNVDQLGVPKLHLQSSVFYISHCINKNSISILSRERLKLLFELMNYNDDCGRLEFRLSISLFHLLFAQICRFRLA